MAFPECLFTIGGFLTIFQIIAYVFLAPRAEDKEAKTA
jgi:hypothetical protein